MADEKKPLKGESQIENVEKVLSRTELFIEENQNKLLAGLGIIVLVVAGFIGVRHFYSIPREKKVQVALFPAENYFAKDSLNLALNGDGLKCVGFLRPLLGKGVTQLDVLDTHVGTFEQHHIRTGVPPKLVS